MGRRPYIQTDIIRRDLRPNPYGSRPNEYVAGANNKEIIGMDGRNDWFRANCRECGQKHITKRLEKSTAYYQCQNCDAWHHVNKGFFDLKRFETKPLRGDEVNTTLYKVKLDYEPSSFDQSDWHYGSKDKLKSKLEDDTWIMVSDIKVVK